ncbi:IS3 family transposase [Salmonella enterica]|nr:IS3 family transposase [Salmonella enterica]
MSRRGNCWDNAMAKSFFSSLKKERIRKRIYKTKDLARADIFDYIEVFYNRPGATVISAASARKPPNRPRREDRICLQAWGQYILRPQMLPLRRDTESTAPPSYQHDDLMPRYMLQKHP